MFFFRTVTHSKQEKPCTLAIITKSFVEDDCYATVSKHCSFLHRNYVVVHTDVLRLALILKRQYSDSAVHNENWIFHYYFMFTCSCAQHKAVCAGKFCSSSLVPRQNCSHVASILPSLATLFPAFSVMMFFRPLFLWLCLKGEPPLMERVVLKELKHGEWKETFRTSCRSFFFFFLKCDCDDGENRAPSG